MNDFLSILAQLSDVQNSGGAPAGGAAPTGAPTSMPPTFYPFLAFLAAMMVFMFIMSRNQRKREEKKRNNLLDNIKKNDRVMTIGGIIGTVVNVKEGQITLKVDEGSNTKITFAKRAIQQVLQGDEEPKLEDQK